MSTEAFRHRLPILMLPPLCPALTQTVTCPLASTRRSTSALSCCDSAAGVRWRASSAQCLFRGRACFENADIAIICMFPCLFLLAWGHSLPCSAFTPKVHVHLAGGLYRSYVFHRGVSTPWLLRHMFDVDLSVICFPYDPDCPCRHS